MKKGLLLGALLLIGTQAMADQGQEKHNGIITNKFTVTGFKSVNNDFKDEKNRDGDLDGGYGLDYALMYNVTDRFRIGGETGFQQIKLGGQTAKDIDDSVEGVKLGVIGEYDFYVNGVTRLYFTGALGVMGGSTEKTQYTVNTTSGLKVDEQKTKIETNMYSKIGLGLDYNGFLVETGLEAVSFTYTGKIKGVKVVDEDGITNTSVYVSLGYKF